MAQYNSLSKDGKLTEKEHFVRQYANAIDSKNALVFITSGTFISFITKKYETVRKAETDVLRQTLSDIRDTAIEWHDYNLCLYSVLRKTELIKEGDVNRELYPSINDSQKISSFAEIKSKLESKMGDIKASAKVTAEAAANPQPTVVVDKYKNGVGRYEVFITLLDALMALEAKKR